MNHNENTAIYRRSGPPPENETKEPRDDKLAGLVKYYESSTTALVVQKEEKWLY